MPCNGDKSDTCVPRQSSDVSFNPCNGDRSNNLPLREKLPLQERILNPTNARTGQRSATLSLKNPSSVTTPFSISGVPFPSIFVTFPSNPGFNSTSFLATASTCFSAGRA